MMGRRGPAPTPTRLRVLRGDKRPLNSEEPKPLDRPPVLPDGMTAEAVAVWTRVLADYGEAGVIMAVDADGFRIYCEAVARYDHAAALLADSGPLVRGARSGDLIKNPLHQIVRDNAELVRSLARELGLTPAARANLHVQASEADDSVARWLAQ